MKETCECGNKTLAQRPMKFSLDDRFSSYRRKAKINEYVKSGLI